MPQVSLSELLYLVGDESDKWPMIKDSSNFFMQKFNSMNYLTVGLENFPYPDYLINSKIVSNWHIVAIDSSDSELINNTNIDKFRQIEELSRNYSNYDGEDREIQFGVDQFIDYDTTKLQHIKAKNVRQDFTDFVQNLDSLEVVRIDSSGNERWVLSTILETGFLPSLIYVRFSQNPETCVLTRNTIGNLRMLGYALLYSFEGKYVFYFTNQSAYDLFDVTETSMQNPLVAKTIKVTTDAYKEWENDKQSGFSVKLKKHYA